MGGTGASGKRVLRVDLKAKIIQRAGVRVYQVLVYESIIAAPLREFAKATRTRVEMKVRAKKGWNTHNFVRPSISLADRRQY